MSSPIKTLVVPIAGAGTRLRPITYVTPKELLRLVDKPIIYYILAEAYQAGITNVVCITHVDNTQTKDFFEGPHANAFLDDFPGLTIRFIETSVRKGDGQAILLAKDALPVEESFAVTMGDLIPILGSSLIDELVQVYTKTGVPVISVEEIAREKTGQYGVIDPLTSENGLHRIRSIVEKPAPEVAPSNLAMTGKYILTPEIFTALESVQEKNGDEELKLAHALNLFAKENPLDAYECKQPHYDTGTKEDLFKTEALFTAHYLK